MKRLLLITHAYPPCPEVGSLRPAGLAKYLPDFGWEALVLTVKIEGPRPPWATVVETGYEDVLRKWKRRAGLDQTRSLHEQFSLPTGQKPNSRPLHTRMLSLLSYLITFPDSTKGWLPFAMQSLAEIKQSSKVDAILTTSPPPAAHMIGRRAKEIFRCPWLADFRDLWSQNLAHTHHWLQLLERPIERKTLRHADVLITVSEEWAARLRKSYPQKQVACVTNGFDPDDYPNAATALTPKLTLTYTGRLYEGKRDPSPLFEALRQLCEERKISREAIQIRFYGPIEPWLPVLVQRYGLEDVVHIAGQVGREEAIMRQRESQVLLMLVWSDPRETGQYTGKLFEYLGARRPILAIGGARGATSELLDKTGAGVHCLSVAELKDQLCSLYEAHQGCGRVPYNGRAHIIDGFSHERMAAQFAELLERQTSGDAPSVAVGGSHEVARAY
jgi:glycosyltransferase involved in cell wall biosynthesis